MPPGRGSGGAGSRGEPMRKNIGNTLTLCDVMRAYDTVYVGFPIW